MSDQGTTARGEAPAVGDAPEPPCACGHSLRKHQTRGIPQACKRWPRCRCRCYEAAVPARHVHYEDDPDTCTELCNA